MPSKTSTGKSPPCRPARSVLRNTDEEGDLLQMEYRTAGKLNKHYQVVYGQTKKLKFEVLGEGLSVKQIFDIAAS